LWFLGHTLDGDPRLDWLLIGSVVVIYVYFKGGATDKAFSAQEGARIVVGNACVKGSQDWVIRPVGAVVATESMTGS
jgi:hypothetical protein